MYMCLQHNVPNGDVDSLHLSFLLPLLGSIVAGQPHVETKSLLADEGDPYKM